MLYLAICWRSYSIGPKTTPTPPIQCWHTPCPMPLWLRPSQPAGPQGWVRLAVGKRDRLPPRDIGIARRAARPATSVKRQAGLGDPGVFGFLVVGWGLEMRLSPVARPRRGSRKATAAYGGRKPGRRFQGSMGATLAFKERGLARPSGLVAQPSFSFCHGEGIEGARDRRSSRTRQLINFAAFTSANAQRLLVPPSPRSAAGMKACASRRVCRMRWPVIDSTEHPHPRRVST